MPNTVRKENPLQAKHKMLLRCRGYLCRELLGEGAFSHVYRVESLADSRVYACKIGENTKMQEWEAAVMSTLSHPLFPVYHDFWKSGDTAFLVREYIPGESLDQMLGRGEFLFPVQIIRLGIKLAEGLSYLHNTEQHFLFRDIKPANVILRQDGGVKLIDLGCVCPAVDSAASRAGSVGFAAPEQMRGGALTPACDVYGLGKTLQAACGEYKLKQTQKMACNVYGLEQNQEAACNVYGLGQSLRAAWRRKKRRIFGQRPGDRRVRRQLKHILDRCTKEDPRKRIQDMESVRIALKDLLIKP